MFLGLDFLKNSVPDIQSNPAILSFLTEYTNMGYLSIFLFLFIGTVLTIVVQSSSATMAITLIMCSKGWISFDIAAAMILGENIGTTITANMAALSANISAKRAAFAHFLFNIFGVCWVLILFYPFTKMIATLVTEFSSFGSPYQLAQFIKDTDPAIINQISEMTGKPSDPELAAISNQYQSMQVSVSYALSLFHTVFNIINVLIMGWFVNAYVFIVTRVIKQKNNDDEEFQLKYISGGMLSTSELSLLQVKKEILVYTERTHRMFGMVRDLLHMKEGSEEYSKLYSRIEKYEQISDRMELEIANYLNKVADGRLSYEGKLQITAMLTMVTEIESMGDSCYHLARTMIRKQEAKTQFSDEIVSNIDTIFKLVDDAINNMMQILPQNELDESDLNRTYNKETEINNFRNVLRITNIENVNAKKYEYQAGTFYMDLVEEAEKLADYVVNVVEAIKEKRKISK